MIVFGICIVSGAGLYFQTNPKGKLSYHQPVY